MAGAGGSTLAARCTACHTVFRVVPDQLRVSDGWVRCGRCGEVFNAAETLIDLDSGAPRRLEGFTSGPMPLSPPPPPPPPPQTTSRFERAAPVSAEAPATPTTAPHAPPDTGAAPPADAAVAAGPPATTDSFELDRPPPPAAAARVEPVFDVEPQARAGELPDDAPLFSLPAATPADTVAAPPISPATAPPAEPAELPSFLRRADRAARWRRPRVRVALAGTATLLALALLAQGLFVWRDVVAARWPALAPALAATCRAAGCTLGPARAIEQLGVESSALVRVERSDVYRLSVALRNRADIALALPALDLSLTDTQGRLVARRVLQPAELGSTAATLPAGRELTLQAALRVPAAGRPGGRLYDRTLLPLSTPSCRP